MTRGFSDEKRCPNSLQLGERTGQDVRVGTGGQRTLGKHNTDSQKNYKVIDIRVIEENNIDNKS